MECKFPIFFCISAIGLNLPAHFPLCQASANIAAFEAFAFWNKYSNAMTSDIGWPVVE